MLGELLVGAVGVAVFLHALRAVLFDGRTVFIHDVLYWTYPVFHFFADNLLPVTIGNLIGGVIMVGGLYWFAYLRPHKA